MTDTRRGIVAAALIALIGLSAHAFAGPSRTAGAYNLLTTGNVRVSLPAVPDGDSVLYRAANGKWARLPVERDGGVMRLHINVADIADGRTTLLLQVPRGVNLDDNSPPRVVRFIVDGVDQGPVSNVALGGVEMSPRLLEIEVVDDHNAIRTSSFGVTFNGRRYTQRSPGITLERITSRRVKISIDLQQLAAGDAVDNALAVTIDDYAVDEQALTCYLSYRHATPHRLEDGTLLSVDTVTSSAGWEQWWVIADGQKMDASSGSTAGKTWLSEPTSAPHWVKMQFPDKRAVSGVEISWAYYETYRTSVAYKVQTWSGSDWVTQVEVSGQKESQTSRHEFDGPVQTDAIRIWQPSMSGHPGRAEYMWISELAAF